mgnify:CR=1 FL=1
MGRSFFTVADLEMKRERSEKKYFFSRHLLYNSNIGFVIGKVEYIETCLSKCKEYPT